MDKDSLKEIMKLVNWFTAHTCSSYSKADGETKKHIDGLYLEFNTRWEVIIQNIKSNENQIDSIIATARAEALKEVDERYRKTLIDIKSDLKAPLELRGTMEKAVRSALWRVEQILTDKQEGIVSRTDEIRKKLKESIENAKKLNKAIANGTWKPESHVQTYNADKQEDTNGTE